MNKPEYLLGTSDAELDRLAFQQEVWAPVTEAFLDRLGIPRGARVLDLGCGPGFVLDGLVRRVGPTGRVVAVDVSPRWRGLLEERRSAGGWANVELIEARVEELELEPESFDLVFSRWLFCFLSDPRALVARLARSLAPGGILAIQDYNHEGISIFPESAGFAAAVRATRAWFAAHAGDTFVAPRLPGHMRAAGLELVDLLPNVLAGGPDSQAFRWADRFFPYFVEHYRAEGLMSAQEQAAFRREWAERKADPDAIFCSPIVLDVAGRRPG